MPRQRPRRIEHLDQPLERQIGMAIGGKVAGPHPPDQRLEPRVARSVGAQHQGIDEEPDQLVQRGVAAPGDRAADGDVGARPEPRQQPRQRRLQHHEQARASPRASAASPRCRPASIVKATRPPRWLATAGRGRSAGSSICSGSSGQRRRPVRQLPRHHACAIVLGAEHRLLPQRVVGILHRQRRKPGRHPRAARPVKRRQIPRQRPQRPAVAGDVMQQQQQHMLLGAELEQMRPQRQLARQIEAPPGRSRQRRRKLGLLGRRNRKPQPRRRRLKDLLPRHPEMLREHRAQALVPLDQVAQRALQRRAVEPPDKPQRQRDHVGIAAAPPPSGLPLLSAPPPAAARLQPLQEPQPALRIGQRDRRRTRPRHQPRTRRARLRPKPQRQRRHARRLEQAADRNLDIERRTDPADQPRRQQRMPAKLEEVVLDADPRKPQHLGKQPA